LGWVGVAYLFLTGLFTFPLILNFSTSLPGQLLEDRDQNLWNLWWVKESLLHLKNPFHTDFIYYPDGVSLYFHTLNPLNGVISLPVQLFFGTVAAYNFIVFFSFVMAGIGSYLLLLHLTRRPAAAFCASLIFVFAPYHMGTLKGLMQLISLEWLPFYVLFLLRATRPLAWLPWRKRWPEIGAASLCLILTALTDWYYTIFLLSFTLLYLGWRVAVEPLAIAWKNRRKNRPSRSETSPLALEAPFYEGSPTGTPAGKGYFRPLFFNVLAPAGLIGLLFGLAIFPLLRAMFAEMGTTNYYLPDPNDTLNYSADLLALFIPGSTSTLFGWIGTNVLTTRNVSGPMAAQVFLGYLPLGLGLLGLVVAKRSRFWGVSGLLFTILALGPALRLNGPQPGWWMPYALIENLPVIKIMRSPDRFIVMTMLCLAVCAGYGLAWLMERLDSRLAKVKIYPARLTPGRFSGLKLNNKLVAAALSGLLIAELLQIPYPVNSYKVSPFFVQLGQDSADYSLLELPAQGGYWSGADRMAEQAVHHKRIFDGYISREYDHPFQRNTPGFRELSTLKFNQDIIVQDRQSPQNPLPLQDWYDAFSFYKVRYIILRMPDNVKQANSVNLDDYRAAIQKVAPGAPVYRDGQIEVYAVPQAAAPRPFLAINGANWFEPEPSANPTGSFHRWASGPANLTLAWEGPGLANGVLSFNTGTLEGTKQAEILLDGKPVWSGYLTPSPQTIKISLQVTPGQHQIIFDVQGKAKRPVSIGMGNDNRALLYFVQDVSFE
jgi:hypothetical protein